jgi:hypothetical protein
MSNDEDYMDVEVEIIPRGDLDRSGGRKISGFVSRVDRDSLGEKYLTLSHSPQLGDCVIDLCVADFFITQVWWNANDILADSTTFSHNEEDQNEAFETIEQLLMEGALDESGSKEQMTVSQFSPKRMEIRLRMLPSPKIERRLVVTQVQGPGPGAKYYAMKGRLWNEVTNTLSAHPIEVSLRSDIWSILEIQEYRGGYGQPITHFLRQAQRESDWDKVLKFYGEMTLAQTTTLLQWSPPENDDDDDDEEDLYGHLVGTHHTQRIPQHYQGSGYTYKPPVAMLRMRGDEVGALLHADTLEQEELRPEKEREMSLGEYLEKKDEAGVEEEEAPAETQASSKEGNDDQHSDDRYRSGAVCINCGAVDCQTCEGVLGCWDAAALGSRGLMH